MSFHIALPLKIRNVVAADESYCSLSSCCFKPTVNLNLPNYLLFESRLHDCVLSFTTR